MEFTKTIRCVNTSFIITIDREIVRAYDIRAGDQVVLDLRRVIRKPIRT